MLTERPLVEVSNFVNADYLPSKLPPPPPPLSTRTTNDAKVINYFANDVADINSVDNASFLIRNVFFRQNVFQNAYEDNTIMIMLIDMSTSTHTHLKKETESLQT